MRLKLSSEVLTTSRILVNTVWIIQLKNRTTFCLWYIDPVLNFFFFFFGKRKVMQNIIEEEWARKWHVILRLCALRVKIMANITSFYRLAPELFWCMRFQCKLANQKSKIFKPSFTPWMIVNEREELASKNPFQKTRLAIIWIRIWFHDSITRPWTNKQSQPNCIWIFNILYLHLTLI